MRTIIMIAMLALVGCVSPGQYDYGFRPVDSAVDRLGAKLASGADLTAQDRDLLRLIDRNLLRCAGIMQLGDQTSAEWCVHFHEHEIRMIEANHEAAIMAIVEEK